MKPDPERAELALGVDVLAPEGYGEIIGGGERLADLDLLLAADQGAQPAAGSVRVVSRPAPLRHGAARRLRHGHRARRRLDLRARARARNDSVSADAVSAVSVDERESTTLPIEVHRIMKIGLISLGCPKNLVDSEVMLGLAREAGHELTQRRGRRRRARRQHLRVHRLGEAGIDRRHPRDGAAQEGRRVPAADRDRLPGRAVSRRAASGDPGDRRRARHRRSARRSSSAIGGAHAPGGAAPLTFFTSARAAPARARQPRAPGSAVAARLHLRRRHAAAARHAAALRVRQGRRRLRLQVRVLHHPDAARRLSQPAGRLDRPRSARAGRARRQGAAAHLAGHDVLRHRSAASAARSRGCCAS